MKEFISQILIFLGLAQEGGTTTAEHPFFTKGYRIVINTKIEDVAGIYEARVYMKSHNSNNYQVYALMDCEGNQCHAELPRTSVYLKHLDYIIVHQNSAGVASKSKAYSMEKRDMLELPEWQTLNKKKMTIYTEYAKPLHKVNGFTDDMHVKTRPDSDYLGVKVGLYPMELINPSTEKTCPKCPECKE